MSKKGRSPKDFNKGSEFIKFAKKHGAEVIDGKGSHIKIKKNGQTMIMSRGKKGRYPNGGMRFRLIKDFKRLGILILLIGYPAYLFFYHI